MLPTVSSVHIDKALTNVSTAYYQDPADYVAGKIFPSVPVSNKTDKYYVFNKNDALREKALERAPGTESAGGGFRLSEDSYDAKVFAWHVDLDDQVRANADAGLNLMRSASRHCTDAILRQMEADWAATVFTTGVWTDLVGGSGFAQWSAAGSTPIEDIENARIAMRKRTGKNPNTAVLGAEVYSKLKNHPDLRERIQFAGTPTSVTRAIMADLFEIPNIFVAEAIAATNLEGETEAYDFMFGKHAWIGYVAPAAGMETASAGYIFTWSEVSDGSTTAVGTMSIDMPWIRSIRVESQLSWDVKVVGSDLGTFFQNAIV